MEPESLPTSCLAIHLFAGALAGVLEHCIVYPIDSLKTKMQTINLVESRNYSGLLRSIKTVARTSGILSTYKGINAIVLGAGPAHAVYFASYEKMKLVLKSASGYDDTHVAVSVVKQRLQMINSPYSGVFECIRMTVAREGFRAFYRSYVTQLTMNVPFQATHLLCYENLSHCLNPGRKYDAISHIMAGAGAGAVAAIITTPLDVIKTTLNTQESAMAANVNYLNGMCDAGRTIYNTRGLSGFVSGIQARVMFHIPSTAICWLVYEFFKYNLSSLAQSNAPVAAASSESKSRRTTIST